MQKKSLKKCSAFELCPHFPAHCNFSAEESLVKCGVIAAASPAFNAGCDAPCTAILVLAKKSVTIRHTLTAAQLLA